MVHSVRLNHIVSSTFADGRGCVVTGCASLHLVSKICRMTLPAGLDAATGRYTFIDTASWACDPTG
jgi:hypothetical protein